MEWQVAKSVRRFSLSARDTIRCAGNDNYYHLSNRLVVYPALTSNLPTTARHKIMLHWLNNQTHERSPLQNNKSFNDHIVGKSFHNKKSSFSFNFTSFCDKSIKLIWRNKSDLFRCYLESYESESFMFSFPPSNTISDRFALTFPPDKESNLIQ